MKLVMLIPLLLVLAALLFVNARRRAAARLREAEAVAKARAARRNRVPTVSSNLKGVTATQTIQPVRPASPSGSGPAAVDDDRAA